MPKKKTETVEIVEEVVATENVETTAIELSESEQIVAGNAELEQIKKDIALSRAQFVEQTDKQIARIAELDSEIASKIAKSEELTNIIDVVYPSERAKFVEVQNAAFKAQGDAEKALNNLVSKEKELEKREKSVSEKEEKTAIQKEELEALSVSLTEREKIVANATKEFLAFKKSL